MSNVFKNKAESYGPNEELNRPNIVNQVMNDYPSNYSNAKMISSKKLFDVKSKREQLRLESIKQLPFGNASRISEASPRREDTCKISTSLGDKRENRLRYKKILDSVPVVVFMTLATIFVLFANDLKLLLFSPSADFAVNLFYCFFLLVFGVEIGLSCLADENYFGSFFFFMDFIATLSLVMEIDWLFEPMLDGFVSADSDSDREGSSDEAKNIITQATKASRVTRVLRVIRLIRLLRVIKLYKTAVLARRNLVMLNKKKKEGKANLSNIVQMSSMKLKKSKPIKIKNQEMEETLKESTISQLISQSITQKLILIIMVMSVVMPILSEEIYSADDTAGYNILAEYLCRKEDKGASYLVALDFYKEESEPKEPIVNITIGDSTLFANVTQTDEFRRAEIGYAYASEGECTVTFNKKYFAWLNALLGLISTLFTCVLLILASLFFENDTKRLVLDPLEVMIEIVENVKKDPVNAKNTHEIENGVKALLIKMNNGELDSKADKADQKYEVFMIKKAILDISALLAVGFGEAGGQIIKENIKSSKELNPMVTGKKKICIFGFCDIRRFEEIVYRIKEQSIHLVNAMAKIIHTSVDKFAGYPNRNLGDTFLCVWKLGRNEEATRMACAQSILAYMDAMHEIARSEQILTIEKSIDRGENFKLSMGFGLHMGWAIEGAIGSLHKIDASYLSPNVNLSARLEAATKQYGVDMLISGEIHENLPCELQEKFRLVDVVKLKGSASPMRLFTVDINSHFKFSSNVELTKMNTRQARMMLKTDMAKKFEEKGERTAGFLLKTKKFRELLNTGRTKRFYDTFHLGIIDYLQGDWKESRVKLDKCVRMVVDGPSKTLLNYMSSFNFEAPPEWAGFRELVNK